MGLRVPSDAPDVKVTVPESVLLFDQTRPPFTGDVRRFYFRAVKPSEKAEIRFRMPRGEVIVPIEIWSFEDLRQFRTLKGVQLPRRWPLGEPLPELKERQMFPTGAESEARAGQRRMAGRAGRRDLGHAAGRDHSALALDEHPVRLPGTRHGDLPRTGLLSVDA